MSRVLSVAAERFPIAGTFTISRGSKTEAEVITCTITRRRELRARRMRSLPALRRDDGRACAPRSRPWRPRLPAGWTATGLLGAMKAGAARNAIDCALWDLEAKARGHAASPTASAQRPRARSKPPSRCRSATPEAMAAQARANASRPLLKVKIGGDGDIARIRAVTRGGARQPHHPRRQRRLDRRQHPRKPGGRGRTRRRADRTAAARRQGRDPRPDRPAGAGLRRRKRA